MAMRLRAPAKINLDLRVGPRRPDGYHDISTVFQALALHDVVEVTPSAGPLVVTTDDPSIPGGAGNLCAKAIAALWKTMSRPGEPMGYAVHVEKRIPAEAGLGGGSSDAAAVLVAVSREWGLAPGDARVHAAAALVGADVPFFLVGGTALGVGRGDQLTPLADRPPAEVVLVQPPFGLSTAEVYRRFDEVDAAAHAWAAGGAVVPVSACRNDLERAAAALRPEIPALAAWLRRLGAHQAAMTGSGSVVFGAFASAEAADRAADAVAGGGRRVLRTATIDRATCARWREACAG